MVCDGLYTTRTMKKPLKALILLSDHSPYDLHNLVSLKKQLKKNYDLKIDELQDDLFLLWIQKKVWGKLVSGYALIDRGIRGFWIVYTDESGYFVQIVLEYLFNKLYPYISRVYFNYLQIQRFLDTVKEAYHGSSVVTYIAFKKQLRTRRRLKGTHLLWQPYAEEELRKDADRYRIWIDSLIFEVRDQNDITLLEASLTGRGVTRLKFGTFSDFYGNVIKLYIELATEWKNFFNNRERRIQEGKVELRPYILQYPSDLDKPQIEGLIKSLKGSYSHSILFGGNPYFVTNLTDIFDGSSFYLTVLGKKVTITPMLKSTPYALWRIANKVQNVTGEGEILDIQKELGT